MQATSVQGAWMEFNQLNKIKIEGGWLYRILPRSTQHWHSIAESFGVYPSGVNSLGTKSLYKGNVHTPGIAMLGITFMPVKYASIQAWNVLTLNVFNTTLLQTDISVPMTNNKSLILAGQIIAQQAIHNGGNSDPSKTYFAKDGKSLSYGAKVGWKNKQWELSLNYNRITKQGKYLMPREWGRDPFFTFMPRERNEGVGDATALMAKLNHSFLKTKWKASFAAGYYQLPDVKNYPLNKYGLPSYIQLNADARYSFSGKLSGLETQLLLVSKLNQGKTYNEPKFILNKVNMHQLNWVLNYYF